MKVRIAPRTRKEKNRVHEHGDIWKVLRRDNFRGQPSYLCRAQDGYLRWWPEAQAEKL